MWEGEGAIGMMAAAAAVVARRAQREQQPAAGTAAQQEAAEGRKGKERRKKGRKSKWKGGYDALWRTIGKGRTGRARSWTAAEQMLWLAGGDATGGGQEGDTGRGGRRPDQTTDGEMGRRGEGSGSGPQRRGGGGITKRTAAQQRNGMVTKGDLDSTRAVALLLYMRHRIGRGATALRAGEGAAEATGGERSSSGVGRECEDKTHKIASERHSELEKEFTETANLHRGEAAT